VNLRPCVSGGTRTVIIPKPTTVTIPKPTTVTVTRASKCTRRTAAPSPTAQPNSHDNRTWGCFPGTICIPIDRCPTEPIPERNYICPLSRCKPAPPPIKLPKWCPGAKFLNVTLQLPYFPIDPTIFGYDDRIWFPIVGQETLKARDGGLGMDIFGKNERRGSIRRQISQEEQTALGDCLVPCRMLSHSRFIDGN